MTDRSAIANARRVVVKVGSSSLTSAGGGIDTDRLAELVNLLAAIRVRGVEVVLVSSGAIAAALAPLGMRRRPRALAAQQAAASVGQGLLMGRYTEEFARHGVVVGQVLLTLDDVTRRAHYRNASATFSQLLEMGVMPIVNENDTVATTEIRFGDNDRLAGLVAHLVRADALLLISDVDALYTDDPRKPGAERVSEVSLDKELAGIRVAGAGQAGVGTGGMTTKLEAAKIATDAGVAVVLTDSANAAAALGGEEVGTYFRPTGRRRRGRLLWLAHATDSRGSLTLDAGAVRAVENSGASLLAAGITEVVGDFQAGDPVDLCRADGSVFARGLVNFDASEMPRLLGRKSVDLAADLGPGYVREVVHRDDLIVFGRSDPDDSPA